MLNISHPRCGLTLFIYRIKPSREWVIGIYIHNSSSLVTKNEKLNTVQSEAVQYLLLHLPKPRFQLWWDMLLGDIETNNSIIIILFPSPTSISNQSIVNRNFKRLRTDVCRKILVAVRKFEFGEAVVPRDTEDLLLLFEDLLQLFEACKDLYMRTTMSEMRLSNLACISINRELVTPISIKRRIFEWLRMNKRKTVSLYNSYVYKSIANM